MKILLFVLIIIFSSCAREYARGRRADFSYETPKVKITGSEEDNPGHWAKDLLIKNSGASSMQPDAIKKMNQESQKILLLEVLKQKYFFQFKSKMAGQVGIYQIARHGETPRMISFKIYSDPLKARDLIKLNPDIKHEEQELEEGSFVFYVIPKVSRIFRRDGVPFIVKKGDWITKISKAIYNDMDKWISVWKNNDLFAKNPHLIKVGDLLYWYPDWYKKKDPTERNKLPRRNLSSSEAENFFIMEAQENSPPSLKDKGSIQYDEFR